MNRLLLLLTICFSAQAFAGAVTQTAYVYRCNDNQLLGIILTENSGVSRSAATREVIVCPARTLVQFNQNPQARQQISQNCARQASAELSECYERELASKCNVDRPLRSSPNAECATLINQPRQQQQQQRGYQTQPGYQQPPPGYQQPGYQQPPPGYQQPGYPYQPQLPMPQYQRRSDVGATDASA